MRSVIVWLCLVGVMLAGCNVATEQGEDPSVSLKRTLEEVASVGKVESARGTIEEKFQQLKTEEPAKASIVERDIQLLLEMKSPAQIKEKAGHIIGLL